MEAHWNGLIYPIIKVANFDSVLELAAGHGRNSEYLLKISNRLTLVDVNVENIAYCRSRFAGRDERISFIVNSGATLDAVPDASVTLVYCYDSMVHFHSDVVRSYLREFKRILRPGGRAFLHHSNSNANPGGLDIGKHVQGRNFMTKDIFIHYSVLEGFEIISSKLLDWGGAKDLDCITYLQSAS